MKRKLNHYSRKWRRILRRRSNNYLKRRLVYLLIVLVLGGGQYLYKNFSKPDIGKVQSTVTQQETTEKGKSSSLGNIPAYSGNPSAELNGNVPSFTQDELSRAKKSYKTFSELDSLGRCGKAEASIGKDLLPTEKRTSIGMVKPSGWHTVRYDDLIKDKYLYNRCHLIAFSLCGENANPKNLITGTRYFNTVGMLPYEEKTVRYVERTGNHVLYRVTPIFEGNNLVASGVQINLLKITGFHSMYFATTYSQILILIMQLGTVRESKIRARNGSFFSPKVLEKASEYDIIYLEKREKGKSYV